MAIATTRALTPTECRECGGVTEVYDGELVHKDTLSVQCVSAEHCTECGHIVDYDANNKVWVHDDHAIRPGVVPEGTEVPEHTPSPEYGTVLNV